MIYYLISGGSFGLEWVETGAWGGLSLTFIVSFFCLIFCFPVGMFLAFFNICYISFNFYDDPTHIKPWTKHGIYEFLSANCKLNVKKVGIVRNWIKVPLDLIIITGGFLTGNRRRIISSFWNIYGWCVYGIGEKL